MSAYTIKNLKRVEDQAPKFGYGERMESRFAREPLEFERGALSYFRYAPGVKGFAHRHREQEETYVILSGSARVELDGDAFDLGPFDAVRVSPGTVRLFEAGPEGMEMIVFAAPKTAPGDAEMVSPPEAPASR
jgi:mannose-6-phosphate isomerase-like protein (cupin superfamily)